MIFNSEKIKQDAAQKEREEIKQKLIEIIEKHQIIEMYNYSAKEILDWIEKR